MLNGVKGIQEIFHNGVQFGIFVGMIEEGMGLQMVYKFIEFYF